ncbi:MAG: TonB-dependent receptor [Caulobacterales bacterium]
MRHFLTSSCALAVLVTAAPAAYAQSAPQSARTAGSLDEIIVTARKRDESLKDVPISITAVSSETLERNNMARLDQVGTITPNVQLQAVSVNPNNIAPYIRGIGNRAQEPSQDSPVAISIDGVYLTDINGSMVDLFDVQQVEVLRGPQGTLQGRNSPGGAINIRTKRPTGEFGARAEVSYERFNLMRVKGAVEGPLVQDVLAAKASAFYTKGGGYVKNTFTGEGMGDLDTWGGRLGLMYTPNDNFTAYLTGDYTKDNSEQANIRLTPNATAQGPRQPVPVLCSVFGVCTPLGKHENSSNFTEPNEGKTGGLALNMDWDLGNVTLSSVSGYRHVNQINRTDVDASSISLLEATDRRFKLNQYSQELRLASNGNGPLSYVVGTYLLKYKWNLFQELTLNSVLFGAPPPFAGVPGIASQRRQNTSSYAIFAQSSYDLTSKGSGSAGGRYTRDKKPQISVPAPVTTGVFGDITGKFKKFTFDVGTEYHLTDDAMAYIKFSRGYRSGGINGDAPAVSGMNVYDPETLDSIEGGLKSEWMDGRLTSNLAVFHYDFKNIQIIAVDSAPGPIQRVVNGENLKMWGAELENTFKPIDALTLTANIGLLDSKYGHDIKNLGFGPTDLHDIRKEYAPKVTGYLAADYRLPLNNDQGSLTFGGNVTYRSSMATSPVDNPIAAQSKYALVDALVTYRSEDERLSLSVYGQNLTDKYYITTGEATGGLLGFQVVGRPRTWGVRASMQY